MAARLALLAALSLAANVGVMAQTQRYITAGRLIGPAVFSPEGLIFAASEDQRIHYLDSQGFLQASFTLERRWAFGPLHGSGTWLALLTTDRRLHRIDYTRPRANQAGRLSLLWSVTVPARPAAPPALLPGGRIAVIFTDGHLRVWENDGGLIASRPLALPSGEKGLLAVDSNGTVWAILDSHLTVFDAQFRQLGTTQLPEAATQAMIDQSGRLWLVSSAGRLWRINSPTSSPTPLNYRSVLAVLSNPEDLWIITPQLVLVLDRQDRVRKRISTRQRLTAQVVLSSQGRLAVALPNSGIVFLSADGEELQGSVEIEHLALAPGGVLVGSGRDWSLLLWAWDPPPSLGWYQPNAASDGSHRVLRPIDARGQRERWEGYNGYRISRILLERGGRDDVERVLANLERAHSEGMLDTIPYAPGLLLEVCQTGIERLRVENFQLINNWPDFRLRAARLLENYLDMSMRDSVLNLLRLENDARVQVQYVKLLEKLGWDEDGRAATTLHEALRRNPNPALAEAALGFLGQLRQTGSPLSQPAHRSLLNHLFQGPYPRSLRERAWQVLRT